MDRTPTDAEVERLAREVDDILFPDCSFPGTAFEYKERAYTLARHLIKNRGCQVPPDPVREELIEVIARHWTNPADTLMADAILARFNVTPKEESDA